MLGDLLEFRVRDAQRGRVPRFLDEATIFGHSHLEHDFRAVKEELVLAPRRGQSFRALRARERDPGQGLVADDREGEPPALKPPVSSPSFELELHRSRVLLRAAELLPKTSHQGTTGRLREQEPHVLSHELVGAEPRQGQSAGVRRAHGAFGREHHHGDRQCFDNRLPGGGHAVTDGERRVLIYSLYCLASKRLPRAFPRGNPCARGDFPSSERPDRRQRARGRLAD